jgi:hypothetical protein
MENTMKKLAAIVSTILLAGLLSASGQSQSQQPSPTDPTATAPASPAPSTPPTFPRSESGSQTPEQTQQHPENSGSTTSSPSASQGSRTFVGQIILNNNSYLLRSGDQEYKLDDQGKAKKFAGKDVKVLGNLDRETKTIHVDSIEVAPSI